MIPSSAVRTLILIGVLIAGVTSGAACGASDFTDSQLVLEARTLEVTVENRSNAPAGLMFGSDTMHGTQVIPAGLTETFLFDPDPVGPRPPGALPGAPETVSLVLGEAVLGPQGEVLGVAGPFHNVALGRAPFALAREQIFIRIDAGGARWRRVAQ